MELDLQFLDVAQLIKQSQFNACKAATAELINFYWQLGERISKRISSSDWEDKTVDELANYIDNYHPDLKGYSRNSLNRMRQFYETYKKSNLVGPFLGLIELTDIRKSLLATISWSHHLIVLAKTRTEHEREFYVRLSSEKNYTKQELERQIQNGIFKHKSSN